MTFTATIWGGPNDGLVVSNGSPYLVLYRLPPQPIRWDAIVATSVEIDKVYYNYRQLYWPGLGIENLWIRDVDYQRLLTYEQK